MNYKFWCDAQEIERVFKDSTPLEYVEDSFFDWVESFDYTPTEIDDMISDGVAGYYEVE